MDYMYTLRDMMCDELEHIAERGELTESSLDTVQKLTHSIKSIDTILAMAKEYPRRSSYRREKSHTDATEMMVHKLEKMMEQTSDPSVQHAIQQAVNSLAG